MKVKAEFVVRLAGPRDDEYRRLTVEADVTVNLQTDELMMRNERLVAWDDYGPPPAWRALDLDDQVRGWDALCNACDSVRELIREEASSELLPFVLPEFLEAA